MVRELIIVPVNIVYTPLFAIRSRTTLLPISSPATAGTHGLLAGTLRRPGGGVSRCVVGAGCSGENTTGWRQIPRFRSSFRMTRAKGQPYVSEMSASPQL